MRRSTVIMAVVASLCLAAAMATSATADGHRGDGFHGGGGFHGNPGPGFRGASPTPSFVALGSGFPGAPPTARFMPPPVPGFHAAPPAQRSMASPGPRSAAAPGFHAAPVSPAAPRLHVDPRALGALPAPGSPGSMVAVRSRAAPGFHGAASSPRAMASSSATASATATATATSVTNVTTNVFVRPVFPHHRVFFDFFFFGGPVFAGPWFRFWDPFWFPPPVVIQAPAPVYVQQPPAPTYWYYCADAQAYYPYVQQCRGGWLTVVPNV
jgi:hypothetical protein